MAESITIKALQDASLDAKSLEEVVNGDDTKQVATRLGESYPSVKKAITQMFENGGLPATPFATKALMEASELVDAQYAMVTDDITANNGLYFKQSGIWAKSTYSVADLVREINVVTARGSLADVTDFRTLNEAGVYLCNSSNNYPNKPPTEVSFIATVQIVGEKDENMGRWVKIDAMPIGRKELYSVSFDATNPPATLDWLDNSGVVDTGIVYQGAYSADMDLLLDAGIYILTDAANLPNMPAGFSNSGAIVEVYKLGGFVMQRLTSTKGDNKIYHRVYTISMGVFSPWQSTSDEEVEDLDTVKYKGAYSGDINDLVSTGFYLLVSANTLPNMPPNFSENSALAEVFVMGGFITQRITATKDDSKIYHRVIRPSRAEYRPWQAAGSTSGESAGNPYAGKTIVFLGDSITENGSYPTKVGERLGVQAINGGFGGTRMTNMDDKNLGGMCGVDVADAIVSGDWAPMRAAAQIRYDESNDDNRAIVDRMEAVDWLEVDYIICFWGTNDYSNNAPLGVDSDNNRDTIKGAVSYITEKIIGNYPHIQIMWVSPMFRGRITSGDARDSDNHPNDDGIYLIEYGDAIKEQAKKYHLPHYDLYRKSGLNIINYATFLRDQTIDGLHPFGDFGYGFLANKIASAFASNF